MSFRRCGRPPPTGSLRLTSVSDRGLNASDFVLVVLGGLFLLPASLGRRAVAVGALVVAVVLAGVFWPTLSMQLLNGMLAAALLIVAVVWSVFYLASYGPSAAPRNRRWTTMPLEPEGEGSPPEQGSTESANEGGPAMRDRTSTRPCSWLIFALALSALPLFSAGRLAAEPLEVDTFPLPAPRRADSPEKVREIFVPFKDLNILLENQPRRVLLSRQQYDELLKKAKITPARHVPQAAVLTAADYGGTSDGQRVRLTGTLAIDVLEEGPASRAAGPRRRGVALRQARRPRRAVGRDADGGCTAGRGRGPPCAGAGNGGPAGDHRRPADALLPPAAGWPRGDCG